ncbi:signal peptidase I [Gallaecimonas kandeliae]|uniref:signal peptidase I n=1 Tax=Gallaecimonas kandeliae TaxID=3029055 RepID=UPI0026482B7C|nr:signal peptidase I [Gallaecimonas kandeliae]WKE66423.1 signal peptidase I [Gallaecimonas kandeliae]
MAQYFSIVLVMITLATGLVWALDRWKLAPRRKEALAEAGAAGGLDQDSRDKLLAGPGWVESCRGAFPVIAAVLVLRSFIFEPFQIPSGSMMPTLLKGDFILVEKFAYGLKEPLFRKKFLATGEPKRGQVFVFKHPQHPEIDMIKRVVGLPGDKIVYRNKHLYIQPACKQGQSPCPGLEEVASVSEGKSPYSMGQVPLERRSEVLGGVKHDILRSPVFLDQVGSYYPHPGGQADEWIVPAGHYFAMGDNRDNSSDSRYWGFVPEQSLEGRAVFIWMSFKMDRGPDSWLPSWVPTGVRFGRLGPIK